MRDDVQINVVTVPINRDLYDALAQEWGYRDVADLEAQHQVERDHLDPDTLALVDRIGEAVEHRVLFGDD